MRTAPFNLALLLDCATRATPPCLYGVGACVLLAKVWPAPVGVGAFVCAALVVWAAVVLILYAGSARFSREEALAWLDWRNEAGGRILAGREDVTVRVRPGITVRPLARALALPGLFVVVSALVPALSPAGARAEAHIEPAVNRLLDEVDEAADSGALTDAGAEELRRQIQQIRQLAEEHPETAAEALAALPQRLDAARAERMDAAAEALEKALDASLAAGEDMDAGVESVNRALENLARAEGGMQALPEEARQLLESGGAGETGESLRRLVDALAKHAETIGNGGAQANANSASESGSGTGTEASRQGAGPAEQTAAERLAAIGEMVKNMRSAGDGGESGEQSGTGGVTRGPGAAPLWLDAPSTAKSGVEYLPLPEQDGAGAEVLLKRDRDRPDAMPEEALRKPWRSAVDAPASVRGGAAGTGVGPGRQGAVSRYFERLGE